MRLASSTLIPRALRLAAALVVAAFMAGCASMVPQTVALRGAWPAGVPQQVELAQVPFFPQEDYQCGPAALAMALQASGAMAANPHGLVDQVWVPARQGSLQVEMLAAARRYNRVSYKLAPRYGDLLREVAAGNPVIVLQDVGFLGTQWHYAAVTGFDYASGTIFLHSGTTERQKMPFTAFERTWMKGGYWAMVVTPPDRIAATATPDRWMEAVLAFSRTAEPAAVTSAYATAHQQWPENLPATIGLANQLHSAGRLEQAVVVLRDALARYPNSVIVRNNLAQTLSDEGKHAEALSIIEPAAADPHNPFASEIKATRQMILERMPPAKAAKS